MTRSEKREMLKWMEERDRVAKTYDVEKFKRFYEKWMRKGLYQMSLPKNDKVIEITLRKMVYHMTSSSPEEKKEAAEWLMNHGCTTEL